MEKQKELLVEAFESWRGTNEQIDDVCVIGIPDEEWGSSVRAVIQLKKDNQAESKELLDFCRTELAGSGIVTDNFIDCAP